MTRKEKHSSVLAIYLTRLEQKYNTEFEKLEEATDKETQCTKLVELYHKIEDIKKEIETLKY